MLESASGSLTSYPGHPPAAYGGLVSLVPDLNSWPSEGARLRRAAADWSKRYDPLLRHEVEGVDGLDSLSHQTGTSEPQPGEHGRAPCAWRDKGPQSHKKPRCDWNQTRTLATPAAAPPQAYNIPRLQYKSVKPFYTHRNRFDGSYPRTVERRQEAQLSRHVYPVRCGCGWVSPYGKQAV